MAFDTRDNVNSAIGGAAVTPADGSDLAKVPTRAIWVGGAGNLKVTYADGTTDTLTGVPAGSLLPIQVKRVFSTGTTATSISALY